jgi:hydroxymethylpyrimidine pyrophosphatase-like HAD family hydrolase
LLSCSYQEIENHFLEHFNIDLFNSNKLSDNLIWSYVLKEEQMLKNFTQTQTVFNQMGWNLEITGKKLYFMPSFLCKWKALDFLNNKYLNNQKVFASGDSHMDLPLVENADIGFIPLHGAIADCLKTNVHITKNIGLSAGEEIISNYLKYVYN